MGSLRGKQIFIFFVGIAALFLIAGCNSDGGNEPSAEPSKPDENDREALYEAADQVALEYTIAHYEYNIPVLFDLAPPKVQDEYANNEKFFSYFKKRDGGDLYSDIPIEDLIDPDKFEEIKTEYNNADYIEKHETFFQNFSSAEEKLYIVRFDHLFETEGELAYFVKPWMDTSDDPNKGGLQRKESSGHIKLKQNNDGEWRVIETTSGQFRKEGINTSDRDEIKAKGTVVYGPEKEDPYGFE